MLMFSVDWLADIDVWFEVGSFQVFSMVLLYFTSSAYSLLNSKFVFIRLVLANSCTLGSSWALLMAARPACASVSSHFGPMMQYLSLDIKR